MIGPIAASVAISAGRENLEGDLESLTNEEITKEMQEAKKRFPKRMIKAGVGILSMLPLTYLAVNCVDPSNNNIKDWQMMLAVWGPMAPSFYGMVQVFRGMYDEWVCEIGQEILEKRGYLEPI